MPTLHALLVAINEYPNPRHQLKGCINDLKEMETFIDEYAEERKYQLSKVVLKDDDATRHNIIEGFNQLAKAQDGDFCLFFFAGHGSKCPSPKEFWHLDPSKLNQTLVCWDSRSEDGQDLIDKEMSYLIWKVTNKKNIHFLSITDCCHSGSNMRLEPVGERRMGKCNKPIPLEKYLGIDEYEKIGTDKLSPPRGKYIHFAASQAHQTAKEVKVGREKRGIFSYLFLHTLNMRTPLSYGDLINRVRFRIRNHLHDQYPVLEASKSDFKDQLFLSNQVAKGDIPFYIYYDRRKGWFINAGAFHQMKVGEGDEKTLFEVSVNGNERKIELTQVFANYSTVTGMEDLNTEESYPAKLIRIAISKLPVTFSTDSEKEGINFITSNIQEDFSKLVELSSENDKARYLIHAKNDRYFLTSPQDERPLFKRILGFSEKSAEDFLLKLEKIANWIQLQELSPPNSSIQDDEFQIELYRGKESGKLEDDASVELVDWNDPGVFSHLNPDGSMGNPTFKLKIRNTSNRPLWASVHYLGVDFGIDNVLMPMERLEPGQEAWCKYSNNGHPNTTIPIKVLDILNGWGITNSHNYLKVLISTSEIDSDQFNQEPLELEAYRRERPRQAMRSMAFRSEPSEDWTAKTITLDIYRPLASKNLNHLDSALLFNNQFETPKGFSAKINLESIEVANIKLPELDREISPDLEVKKGNFLSPVELGPWENKPGLSVLEMRNCNGIENISKDTPLKILFRDEFGSQPSLEVYGLDEDFRFYQLDQHWEGNCLHIQELPEEKEGVVRLFFMR